MGIFHCYVSSPEGTMFLVGYRAACCVQPHEALTAAKHAFSPPQAMKLSWGDGRGNLGTGFDMSTSAVLVQRRAHLVSHSHRIRPCWSWSSLLPFARAGHSSREQRWKGIPQLPWRSATVGGAVSRITSLCWMLIGGGFTMRSFRPLDLRRWFLMATCLLIHHDWGIYWNYAFHVFWYPSRHIQGTAILEIYGTLLFVRIQTLVQRTAWWKG